MFENTAVHNLFQADKDAHAGANLPAPEVIAREIVEDLTAALAEFEAVAAALEAVAERKV